MVDVVEKFLTVIPRNHTYTRYESVYKETVTYTIEPVMINVIKSNGVDMTPDVKINVTDLNDGNKMFFNVSGKGDKFKVQAIFKDDVTVHAEGDMSLGTTSYGPEGSKYTSVHLTRDFRVLDLLDFWIRNHTVFSVVSRAVDIVDGLYVVTGNPSRKQTFEGYTIWELEFTKYIGGYTTRYKVNTGAAQDAVKSYNKQKKATTTKVTQSSSLNSKLGKCDLKNLKYSKSKKVTECTKTLQKYLNKKLGCNLSVDGWYGDATKKWVKKFQEKYKKKYKLKVTGNMDKATLNAMTKV